MSDYLERFKRRVWHDVQDEEDAREVIANLERQTRRAQEMTETVGRLYRLIDEKGYVGAFLAVHGGMVTKPAELAAQMMRERDYWHEQYERLRNQEQ